MSQAILRTRRIHLVALSDDHREHQVELDADPEVMRYLGGARSRERAQEEHREFLAEAVRGLGYWAGSVEGVFVGYWILWPPEPDGQESPEGRAELGYRLLRRYWRQGLGSEGSRELVRHGFEDLGLARIFAMTAAANIASRATMAAAGLRYVRTFQADPGDWPPGTDLRAVEYAITREQWDLHLRPTTCM
ncbi:GNAT family N-acetyltransferase [Streptomyces sp. NPDC059832]|uniref:GNAT family N-acetyltransferase n=1 Tax=unclassified Streptomyces TaxID=2593676 RepID=UPI003649D983